MYKSPSPSPVTTFLNDFHVYSNLYLSLDFQKGELLEKYPHLNKYVILVNFLGKTAIGFSVLVAQTCINGTRKIKHLFELQLLLPFPASLLVLPQNPTGVKLAEG